MQRLIIGEKDGLQAVILPHYGGMVSQLKCGDVVIMRTDESMVLTNNLTAGGCPVLFPFPSKTAKDQYVLNGQIYHMPFHGLVRSMAFAVREVTKNSATMSICSNEAHKQECFPFDYELELTYSICRNSMIFRSSIKNNSSDPMPHCFGWHHYFAASKKDKIFIDIPMDRYIDYSDMQEYGSDRRPILSAENDYVFFGRFDNTVSMKNYFDGYSVTMKLDDSFEAMVVCTRIQGQIAIEPWMGLPDSINTGKYLKWIKGGHSAVNTVEVECKLFDRRRI